MMIQWIRDSDPSLLNVALLRNQRKKISFLNKTKKKKQERHKASETGDHKCWQHFPLPFGTDWKNFFNLKSPSIIHQAILLSTLLRAFLSLDLSTWISFCDTVSSADTFSALFFSIYKTLEKKFSFKIFHFLLLLGSHSIPVFHLLFESIKFSSFRISSSPMKRFHFVLFSLPRIETTTVWFKNTMIKIQN